MLRFHSCPKIKATLLEDGAMVTASANGHALEVPTDSFWQGVQKICLLLVVVTVSLAATESFPEPDWLLVQRYLWNTSTTLRFDCCLVLWGAADVGFTYYLDCYQC